VPLLARMVACPLAIDVRHGAVGGIGTMLADQRISAGGDVAVAVGPGQGEQIAATLARTLQRADVFPVEGGSIEAARTLSAELGAGTYDAVVGIGGGRTIDVAKYAASLTGLPMVAVATSLAHDGLASPVASLVHNERKGSYGVQIPIGVVVDLDYVARSPDAQLRSGLGDALSNLNALADWELAERERGERVDGLAAAFARSGADSLLYLREDVASDQFTSTLARALILGGLAMAVAGNSRPCSGADHEIAHAIDALHPGHGHHGEQVAVGALFASFLRDDPNVGALDDCLHRYGVPRLPGDLRLSEEEFSAVVAHAPTTRPDRYTILEHLDLDLPEIRRRVHDFVVAFDR
jgi:glycerol-1-phosphate dehydrogenase [NAD(P)+]